MDKGTEFLTYLDIDRIKLNITEADYGSVRQYHEQKLKLRLEIPTAVKCGHRDKALWRQVFDFALG
jgi:hypothetical protein